MKDIIDNFPYVKMSFTLMYKSLSEISVLSKPRSRDEMKTINLPIFTNYCISLQYMFNMEFIKLLENNSKSERRNFSSLVKLSGKIYELKGEEFHEKHRENLDIVEHIRSSAFFHLIKTDRDKKFAHTDGDYNGDPWKIKTLPPNDILEGFKLLELMKKVLKNCTGAFGYEFLFDFKDPRTNNFITYHSIYKRYYDKHRMEAISEGFVLTSLGNQL